MRLRDVQPITLQQAFDEVWAWLTREDAVPAYDAETGGCYYLTKDGKRCGIGGMPSFRALTTDKVIMTWNNKGSITGLINHDLRVAKLFQNVGYNLALQLQGCHDHPNGKFLGGASGVTLDEWRAEARKGLEKFAKDHKLSIPASV